MCRLGLLLGPLKRTEKKQHGFCDRGPKRDFETATARACLDASGETKTVLIGWIFRDFWKVNFGGLNFGTRNSSALDRTLENDSNELERF